jgi:hypothetical protein
MGDWGVYNAEGIILASFKSEGEAHTYAKKLAALPPVDPDQQFHVRWLVYVQDRYAEADKKISSILERIRKIDIP